MGCPLAAERTRVVSYQIAEATAAFEDATAAFKRGDFAGARASCSKVLELPVPAFERSYTRLRIAQSCLVEGHMASATNEYQTLTADETAPARPSVEFSWGATTA